MRPGLRAREAVSERHAVAQAHDAIGPRGLLEGMGPVAQAVAVEVLGRRPAHGIGLHDVEVALPLRLPIQAAGVRERARARRRLQPLGPALLPRSPGSRSRPRSAPRSGGARGADEDRECWERDRGARPQVIVSWRHTMTRFKLTLEYVGHALPRLADPEERAHRGGRAASGGQGGGRARAGRAVRLGPHGRGRARAAPGRAPRPRDAACAPGPAPVALNEALPADINVLALEPAARASTPATPRWRAATCTRSRGAARRWRKPFVWWVKDALDAAAMARGGAPFRRAPRLPVLHRQDPEDGVDQGEGRIGRGRGKRAPSS